MSKEVQKYDASKFGNVNFGELQESVKSMSQDRGQVVTFGKDVSQYVLRIMPPYKVDHQGRHHLWSQADIHYNVPVPNAPGDRDKVDPLLPKKYR